MPAVVASQLRQGAVVRWAAMLAMGLARAGGAIKDHIRDIPTFYNAAEHTVLAENMRLTYHLIQRLGPNVIGQRTIFHLAHRL